MTIPIEALGFHVGMVVADGGALAERYQALFGGSFQTFELWKPPPVSVDASLEPSRIRVSYGRYAAMTIEIIQVLEGRGHYAVWQECHGEGVQHLGFWVPDLASATREVLENGGSLTSASIDPYALSSVTVNGLAPAEIASSILPGSVHLDYGIAAVELELLGPSSIEMLRNVFGESLGDIVDLPPWSRMSGDG